MTIKTEAYQIGLSGTASQNFHLTAAAADGTMQLYRGNPGAPIGAALLSIDAAGQITYPGDTGWSAYSSTIASASGVLSGASCNGRYRRMGKTVHFNMGVSVTNNGTGAGSLTLATGLPFASAFSNAFVGRDTAVSGKCVTGTNASSTTGLLLLNFDNTYPGSTGALIILTGTYETA